MFARALFKVDVDLLFAELIGTKFHYVSNFDVLIFVLMAGSMVGSTMKASSFYETLCDLCAVRSSETHFLHIYVIFTKM